MTSRKPSYSDRAHKYCRDVVDGKILASKWIKLACQRHLDDLNRTDSRWYFDSDKVNRVCAFIESLWLSDEKRFILQPFQIWLVASLVGWVDESGTRKYIEALILIPKGNGKSPLAAALGLWFAFLDRVQKAEVYCGAMSLQQAMEVFKPAIDFVQTQPAFARLGVEALKKSIFSPRSGGSFRPVIGRGRHGARPYLAILDELHQAISPDLYDTFKTGCNKTPNSLMLTISTAGVASAENPCYSLQLEAQKVLDGSMPNERFFAAIYCADDSVDWTSEDALRMANPNLGISNDAEKIRLAQIEATQNPAKQNIVRSMHLDQWTTAKSSWLNMQAFDACYDPELTPESLKDLPCVIGFDLAARLDLAAAVKVFKREIDGKAHYYALCRAYLPETRVNLPENQHYQRWLREGWLTVTPDSEIDFEQIEQDALDDIKQFTVAEIRPDDKYAIQLMQRIEATTGVTRVDSITPAEFSEPMKELEAAIVTGRFHHDGNPILKWCLSNVTTYIRRDQTYTMPDKEKADAKIDVAVALLIAMSRAMVVPAELIPTWAPEVW